MTDADDNSVCRPTPEAPAEDRLRRFWLKLRRNKAALAGGFLLLVYLLSALLAPFLLRGDPAKPNLINALELPSLKDPLGTDELGRSILVRIVHGARVSLMIAVGVVAVGFFIGVPLGLISGYFGGKIDFGIQRATDAMLAFPGFLLALGLVAVLGVGLNNTVISIGISMVPLYIRLVRGCVLSVREEIYVEAARAVGTCECENHPPPHPAERHGADHGADESQHGDRHFVRRRSRLSRHRGAAADPRVGHHARLGPQLHFQRAPCGHLPGHRHLPRRLELQSAGRRAAGCARSEVQDMTPSPKTQFLRCASPRGHCGVQGVRRVPRVSRALNLGFGRRRLHSTFQGPQKS